MMEKVSFLEDDKGNKSLMRLLAFWGFIVGAVIAICGVIGMFARVPQWGGIAISTGLGLAAGGEWAKSIQKRAEK